jgi:hypothetical protein
MVAKPGRVPVRISTMSEMIRSSFSGFSPSSTQRIGDSRVALDAKDGLTASRLWSGF